jgi:hypothetical protein
VAGDEVTLWRAPSLSCRDPAGEVLHGYKASDYPGHGPYFAAVAEIAKSFAACYGRGIQTLHVPRDLFESLIQQGILQPDGWYGPAESWHVPPEGLAEFNAAIGQGTANEYDPNAQ